MDIYNTIKDIVIKAGLIALEGQTRLDSSLIHVKESNPRDLVTDFDRRIERFLTEELGRIFPNYGFYGEEYGRVNPDAEYQWVIDPIDGTNSFVHRMAYFSISIALQYRGETIFGMVYAPKLGEMFYAVKNGGAYLDGKRLQVSTSPLKNAFCATGFACLRAGLTENNLKFLPLVMAETADIRRCGSAALDLAYVAAGRYDGFWEFTLNLYDVAAGVLLVQESGGVVSDFYGGNDYPEKGLIAGNPLVHDGILQLFLKQNCMEKTAALVAPNI